MVRDQRSDSEILSQLQTFQPVTDSEKNVWAFWDKGLLNSPPWNQRNVISWVRRLGPEWTVRVLDRVEASPVHISLFVDAKDFPEAFNENTMTGPHIGPHTADLIRLPLLYRYGGVWLDVGFMLFRHLDDICWNTLADPDTSFEMAGFKVTFDARTSMIFNGFIAAKRGNPCIKYWHDIFLKCWEGTTTTEGMHKHPLLAHLPKYEPPGANPFFTYAQFVDYMAQVFCLERLRNLEDPSADWDGPEYFEKKILLFDCGKEIYWAMRMTMWDGRRQFNLLATAKEGNVNRSEQAYRDAEAFVEGILQNSSTLKLSHGLVIPGREYLATIWDQKENHDADVKEGTWAAYLRWASENYCASWKMARVKMPPIEEARQVGGILEVVGNSPA
ncbi:MAG: hypothetical protein Q9190_002507 [Brigantiaea leucoxantha]